LLEGKYLYDIVDAEADISEYKLLILPDCIIIDEKLAVKINKFIENGGYILASGASGLDASMTSMNLNLGVNITGKCKYSPTYAEVSGDGSPAVVYGSAWEYKLCGDESEYKILAERVNPYFNRDMLHFSSHQHTPYDSGSRDYGIVRSGNIIYCGWEIFSEYASNGSITTKELVLMMLENLIGDIKTLEINLGAQGIATLRKQEKESRYILHALYASPVKRGKGIEVIEDILPVYDTSVKIRVLRKPKKVYLAPQGEDINFEYAEGILEYNIERLECHQMTVIDI